MEKYPDGLYNVGHAHDHGGRQGSRGEDPESKCRTGPLYYCQRGCHDGFCTSSLPKYIFHLLSADVPQARNVLATPVPKVLCWSSATHENPARAEYIIIEKVSGTELERVWPSMGIADRFAIVKSIASFQTAWTSLSFKKFGSLYYSNDLKEPVAHGPLYTNANGVEVTDSRFSIGPSTGREFSDDGRATVNIDRGPCGISYLLEAHQMINI